MFRCLRWLVSLSLLLPGLTAMQQLPPGCTSLAFDGQDDFVLVPHDPDLVSSTFTVAAWMRTTQRSGFATIVAVGEDSRNDVAGWWLYVDSAGRFGFAYEEAPRTLPRWLDSGQVVADDHWHHVGVSGTPGSGFALWVDGVRAADFPTYPPIVSSVNQVLSIGCMFGFDGPAQPQPPDHFFTGRIDEVTYWNRRLSAGEFATLALGTPPTTSPNLVARWALDEGQGQVVIDSVGGRIGQLGAQPLVDPADPVWRSFPVDEPAVQQVRPGMPANPSALRGDPLGGPVIGGLWEPSVDHSSFARDAVGDALVVGGAMSNLPVPGLGTVLVAPASSVVLGPVVPGVPFSVGVPDDCALVGAVLFAQAAALIPGGLALTNGLDLRIGTP